MGIDAVWLSINNRKMRPKDAGASSQIEDANVLLLHAPVHMMIFEVELQYVFGPPSWA